MTGRPEPAPSAPGPPEATPERTAPGRLQDQLGALAAITAQAGYVLPEFIPPYDAHQGLREIGATVDALGVAKAFANPNHTELVNRGGVPVMTGTGPEATDDVARFAFGWLAQHPPAGADY